MWRHVGWPPGCSTVPLRPKKKGKNRVAPSRLHFNPAASLTLRSAAAAACGCLISPKNSLQPKPTKERLCMQPEIKCARLDFGIYEKRAFFFCGHDALDIPARIRVIRPKIQRDYFSRSLVVCM